MNSNDQPWFSVGEEVILQSTQFPEYNGEYCVTRILNKGDIFQCRLSGRFAVKSDSLTSYVLNESFKDSDGATEIIWFQSALRKKHKPSDRSFGELMNNLKSVTV